MLRLGWEKEMTCTKCGKTFYDTSYSAKRICLKCQDNCELTAEQLQYLKETNMVIYKLHYGQGKTLELTEEEAWEIYKYLEVKLIGFKTVNFKDEMRKKARS